MIQLPIRYLATVAMFVFRPRMFFARRDSDPELFVPPAAFLATNIILAGIVMATAARLFLNEERSRLDSTVVIGVIAVFHCLTAVVIGKVVGILLNEHTDAEQLLSAFCYASVFYVPLALLLALLSESLSEFDLLTTLEISAVQVVAMVYLLLAMTRLSSLFGRRGLAFASLAGAFATLFFLATGVGIGFWLSQDTQLDLRMQNGLPVGAITVGSQGISATRAQLVGAPIGPVTREWFDFDSKPAMQYSITATHGFGTAPNLRPETKYYFRYVTQHGSVTCHGETMTFRTSSPVARPPRAHD